MNQESGTEYQGIAATVDELVAMRPPPASSGFAPGGRIRTHQFGTNRSIYRGRGMEFDESRVYQPGDDVRNIDWRVTARTGSVHTKLFHEERERPVYILLDCRATMRFGTRDCFKSVLGARVAAQLAWVAIDGGDRIGGMVLSPASSKLFDAKRSRAQLLTFIKGMSDATLASVPDAPSELRLSIAMARLRRVCRPGSLVFLISDFFDADEEMQREFERLALHTQVTSILVHDSLEHQMPDRGIHPFTNGHDVLTLNSGDRDACKRYAQSFAKRFSAIESLSLRNGMAFVPLVTGQNHRDVLHPRPRIGSNRPHAGMAA